MLTANLQEKKLPQKIMKEKQNIKDLSLHYQLHQDSLTNPTLLIPKDPIQHNFINDNLFNNTINPNRMFFNVNQTLMMDLQQTQNVNFQNEAIMNRGYVHKQHNIQGLGQNFMRNQQYANIQQYPSKPSIFNIQPEKEKNWNISESLNEKRDPFLNTNKIIFENEKIKKKLNQGYFKDNFQNQNKQMLNPYQNNQKNVFENKAENEFGNEPEFSPISPINFEVIFFPF